MKQILLPVFFCVIHHHGGEHKHHLQIPVVQTAADDLLNPADFIDHCVSMKIQVLGRLGCVAVVFDVRFQYFAKVIMFFDIMPL